MDPMEVGGVGEAEPAVRPRRQSYGFGGWWRGRGGGSMDPAAGGGVAEAEPPVSDATDVAGPVIRRLVARPRPSRRRDRGSGPVDLVVGGAVEMASL
jgi:hypothetical protein